MGQFPLSLGQRKSQGLLLLICCAGWKSLVCIVRYLIPTLELDVEWPQWSMVEPNVGMIPKVRAGLSFGRGFPIWVLSATFRGRHTTILALLAA